MAANIYDWSLTAANNSNSDSDINWAEGQAPSTVNNSARVMMARQKELLTDIGGSLSAGGTANGLTVTAESAFTAYANGQIISFRATADNTGAATLNVNGVGAKAIRKMDSTGDVALTAGEIQGTGIYVAQYSTALNGGAGAWLLVNPTLSASSIGAQPLDADLTAIAALANTDGNFIVGNGSAWVAESGATARASMGLASSTTDNAIIRANGTAGATQNSGAIISDNNSIDISVADVVLGFNLARSGTGAASGTFRASGGNIDIGSTTAVDVVVLTGGTEAARFTNTGGHLVAVGAVESAGTFAANPAATMLFRPNGRADGTGQLQLGTTGILTSAGSVISGGAVTAAGNFAHTTSGTLLFRPGGSGVSTGQMSLDTSGNLSVAGTTTATTFSGSGASLTSLPAAQLTGTVASARVSGSYTGITGTGALNAGSITSGFGSINIGASTFTTTGAASTGALTANGNSTINGTLTVTG